MATLKITSVFKGFGFRIVRTREKFVYYMPFPLCAFILLLGLALGLAEGT